MGNRPLKNTKGKKDSRASAPAKRTKKTGVELTEKELEKVAGGVSWGGGVGDPFKIQ